MMRNQGRPAAYLPSLGHSLVSSPAPDQQTAAKTPTAFCPTAQGRREERAPTLGDIRCARKPLPSRIEACTPLALLFDGANLKPEHIRRPAWSDHKSTLLALLVLLSIAFPLAVPPVACQFFCDDCADCCAKGRLCPVCLLARTHTAPAHEPLRCETFLILRPSPLMPLVGVEVPSSNDHQLLPSRAPPFLFSS